MRYFLPNTNHQILYEPRLDALSSSFGTNAAMPTTEAEENLEAWKEDVKEHPP